MIRSHFRWTGKWMVCLAAVSMALAASGCSNRKYLDQVMPLVEKNDQVDTRVAKLPKVNPFKHPDYLTKIDGYIATKQAIYAQLELIEPPFMMATTHNRLLVAMRNGIRYLQSEREKFSIAAEKIKTVPPAGRIVQGSEEMEVIREYYSQTSAYQASMREQMMKQQYEKLYYQVKDELERASRF
ncbi:MAG: hypothetical protein HQ583_08170 [Candidatus Abyssubacteria bacterium]|nr:hypothetical protein [Candidatus Abyssubacteria bacterium]